MKVSALHACVGSIQHRSGRLMWCRVVQLESTSGVEAVEFGGAFGLFVNGRWGLSNPLIGTLSYFSAFDAALSDAQMHHLLDSYVQGGAAADCNTLFVDTGMR